jgi:hypothetical protein
LFHHLPTQLAVLVGGAGEVQPLRSRLRFAIVAASGTVVAAVTSAILYAVLALALTVLVSTRRSASHWDGPWEQVTGMGLGTLRRVPGVHQDRPAFVRAVLDQGGFPDGLRGSAMLGAAWGANP